MHKPQDLLKGNNLPAGSTNTPTEAGQTDSEPELSASQKQFAIDAISQIFAEFELVYHNQYIKAFPTLEKLNYAKKLWFSYLCRYPAEQIVSAAKEAIIQSEYLPTVAKIVKIIEQDGDAFGLPDVRSAYLEACQAPSPKASYPWRHLAVYHAGKNTGWYFLANQPENKSFPAFEKTYTQICQQVRQGFQLEQPSVEKLPDSIGSNLSQEDQLSKIKDLQKSLKN
ncbi:MAG: replication protein P [Cellvibrionales bacterium]|nr:replication protein P [Cellvibrionales bacterium]